MELSGLKFDAAGLIPVVVQDAKIGDVLMVAWMNRESLQQTLRTSRMTYWSRSRKCLWVKGETSGNMQHLIEMKADCDRDSLLATVTQTGVACHTGARSCFFESLPKELIPATAG